MLAKNKRPKKNSPQGRKYFVHSQYLSSCDLPDLVKELLHKERASFRRTVPTVVLEKDDLKDCREVTKKIEKVKQVNENGEVSEIEIELTSYDVESWRYYLQPKNLGEVEDFLETLGMRVNFSAFDPEDADDEMVLEVEENLGIPASEEKCIIMNIQDAYLFNQECDDPNCGCHPGEE